jgi:hypothetical protein
MSDGDPSSATAHLDDGSCMMWRGRAMSTLPKQPPRGNVKHMNTTKWIVCSGNPIARHIYTFFFFTGD